MSMGIETDDELPLLLLDDEPGASAPAWKLLIVDDEPEIHMVTRMVLGGLSFRGRGLEFLSAHGSAEALRVLDEHKDVALVLLDVVMETDDAGLRLVPRIRNELGNALVRIILRTGQAGQAPERQVILEYDINDYKEKTELTAQKLATCVVAALRGYLTLVELAALNQQLEQKVAARTAELERINSRLERSLAALEQGERAGRQVQFKLLPPQPWRRRGLVFRHLLLPSEFMSGDFVDYFAIDDSRIGCYIADVSGHGVASAFVTVYLKRFVSTLLEAHRHGQPSPIADPAELLGQFNHELLREKVGKHVAICYLVFDLDARRLTYANAGAFPYPLLAEPGAATRYIAARSTPAGLLEQTRYQNQQLPLPERFRLLLCSDGVLEVLPQAEGSEQRLERLRASLDADCPDLQQICTRLGIADLSTRPDDLTLLLVGRDPSAEPE